MVLGGRRTVRAIESSRLRVCSSTHNPKVVRSNLTPATISKSCFRIVLRDKRRANWCFRFIAQFAQFKSQPSFLAPFPPISLVVPQLSRVEVDQVLRMAEPQFNEVVRHPGLAEYRKTKAAERVVSVEADGIVVRKAYPGIQSHGVGSSAVSGAGRDVEVGRSTAVAVNRSGFGGRGRGP